MLLEPKTAVKCSVHAVYNQPVSKRHPPCRHCNTSNQWNLSMLTLYLQKGQGGIGSRTLDENNQSKATNTSGLTLTEKAANFQSPLQSYPRC